MGGYNSYEWGDKDLDTHVVFTIEGHGKGATSPFERTQNVVVGSQYAN